MKGIQATRQGTGHTCSGSPGLEELNLVEFPLALLARQIPSDLKTLRFEDSIFDRKLKRRVHRQVIVTAADAWGLPNALDMDVFLALMKLTHDKHGFRERTVEFSLYELLGLLGWPQAHGGYNTRLKQSLDRWLGVTVKYVNAWRKKGCWTSTKGFHFLDNVELTNTRSEYDADEPQVFLWNKVVMESVQASHTKGLDWDFYRRLKLPSTKRLYRFLDKRFWQRTRWDFELIPFCTDKLGMNRAYEPRKYKQKLGPAIAELESQGFLAPVPEAKRFARIARGVYRVNFERAAARRRKGSRSQLPAHRTGLAGELLKRDVRNGEKLAASYPEQKIVEQIENFDDRRTKGEQLGGGWLRKAIEEPNGYAFRQDYQSKADQAAAAKRNWVQAGQARQSEQAEVAEFEREKIRVENYLRSLPREQRAEIEREAVASNRFLRREAQDSTSRCSDRLKQTAVFLHVRNLLSKTKA